MTSDETDAAVQRLEEIGTKGTALYLTRGQKIEKQILRVCAVLGIGAFIGLGAVYLIAKDANDTAHATCPLYHDLATLPLPDNPGQFSLTFTAKLRIVYDKQGCTSISGVLPKPDPRVAALLPEHLR